MTEYPRRKPNPILHLIRWVSVVLVIYVILRGIVALYGLLVWGNVPALDGLLVWGVPFVLAFGYLAFILFRNRGRRANP
jgi:hypothetical protein